MAGASYDRYNAYVALPQIEKDGQKTKESVKTVEKGVETVQGNVDALSDTVDLKANSSDVYAKTETYSKTETDSALNGKANTSHTHTKSQITDFPSQYPTNASVSNGKLTITKQDSTTVEFQPASPADYVTEKGTSGSWAYRKWNSGKIEAWASITTGSLTMSEVGELYRSSEKTYSFPSGLFSSTPRLTLTLDADTGAISVVGNATSSTSYHAYFWATNGNSRAFTYIAYAVQG